MRSGRPLLAPAVLALLALADTARAADAPLPPPPPHAEAGPRLGLAMDAGFPSGASVALAFRPVPQVRLYAGPAWNVVSWGFLGGLALVPFRLPVAPALSGEVGRYLGADLTRFVNTSSGAFAGTAPLLRDVGVTYAALHAGVEVGSDRAVSFSIRAGLAWLWASSSGRTEPTGGGAQVTLRDASVHATAPSVKLGLQVAF